MPQDTMTPRERWLAVVNHDPPDRLPMYYRATGEATRKLLDHLGCDANEMFARLHIDTTAGLGASYVGPTPPAGEDMYGCRSQTVDYGTGAYVECVYHPLAAYTSVAEIEAKYTWPSVDWYDYSDVSRQAEAAGGRVVAGGGSEPYLLYKRLRGEEQAYMDLLEHPDMVHYCMEKLYGFCYENTRRIYEQAPGKVDVTSVAEDMGAQDRLLYSREHLEEFFFPYMQRMMDLAHEAGARVNTHSDGAIREILPDLIDMGANIVNPIQWRCDGMDRAGLARDFGKDLVFEGGVDNQYTLPFGTTEEVREEVCENIRVLGAHGGYVMTPCHNIQAVGPPENVVAMYETGYAEGWI